MIKDIFVGNKKIIKVFKGNEEYKIPNFNPPIDDDQFNENEVPYISTYSYDFTTTVNKSVRIEFYITDYYQKEYLQDDYSEEFSVIYSVEGKKNIIKNLKAGNHYIDLVFDSIGEKMITLQVVDSVGRKSHILFNKILVKKEIIEKVYKPTLEELKNKFKIYSNRTNAKETTLGFMEMINWSQKENYTKIILPFGEYLIDGTKREDGKMGIYIDAKNLTLDLNKSLMKMEANNKDSSLVFSMENAFDSHVINGVIEGDLDEHDFDNAPNSSEWVNAVLLSGCDYCSYEDIEIRKITGYGTTTNFGGIVSENAGRPIVNPSKWILGDIDETTGLYKKSNNRYTTEDFTALAQKGKNLNDVGFIQVGYYLGYQGNATGNWVYHAHFYDENYNYIETLEGYAYRPLYFSKKAVYMKLTLLSNEIPSNDISIYALKVPRSCVFKNIKHKDIRCVGMALAAFNNLLVENCTFEHCGWKLARCAFDAEDGWDLMQDLYMKGAKFKKGTENGYEFLCAAGHNFVVEDCSEMGTFQYERCRNFVYRNNIFVNTTEIRSHGIGRSGYFRVYDNVFENGINLKSNREQVILKIKNSVLKKSIYGRTINIPDGRRVIVENSTIDGTLIDNSFFGITDDVDFINCNFINFENNLISGTNTFEDCIFNGLINLSSNNSVSEFINCKFDDVIFNRNPSSKFYNSEFNHLRIITSGETRGDELLFENCTINDYDEYPFIEFKNGSKVKIIFRNCIITQDNNDFLRVNICDVDMILDNCTLYKTGGILLTSGYDNNYMVGKVINVTLINTPLDKSVKRMKWDVNEEPKLNNIKVVER